MNETPHTFLSKDDLKYFNDTVNSRVKDRLKYKGDFTITSSQTDWNGLAPTEIAYVYQLTGTPSLSIAINATAFEPGDWIITLNKTLKDASGNIIDEDGNPSQVQVAKLWSANMDLSLLQKKVDTDITVVDNAGDTKTAVVDALNTLSDLDAEKVRVMPDAKNSTRQYCFDEAFKAGKPLVWRNMTWASTDLPPSVGSGTSGMTICCPSLGATTAAASRWGNIIWQSQGSGEIYVSYLKQGVPQAWTTYGKPLWKYSMDFRLDANKKFGLVEPFFSTVGGSYTNADVWRYYRKIANPSNNDHFQALLVNPMTLSWNSLPSGAIPLTACVTIGAAAQASGDDAEITLNIRYFLNGTVSDYRYSLGTVGSPTVGIYKPTWIQIN